MRTKPESAASDAHEVKRVKRSRRTDFRLVEGFLDTRGTREKRRYVVAVVEVKILSRELLQKDYKLVSYDFAINDLMLGTSDPFFWFLVPLFALISVGICIAVNYVVLVLTHVFALLFKTVQACVSRSAEETRYVLKTMISLVVS